MVADSSRSECLFGAFELSFFWQKNLRRSFMKIRTGNAMENRRYRRGLPGTTWLTRGPGPGQARVQVPRGKEAHVQVDRENEADLDASGHGDRDRERPGGRVGADKRPANAAMSDIPVEEKVESLHLELSLPGGNEPDLRLEQSRRQDRKPDARIPGRGAEAGRRDPLHGRAR